MGGDFFKGWVEVEDGFDLRGGCCLEGNFFLDGGVEVIFYIWGCKGNGVEGGGGRIVVIVFLFFFVCCDIFCYGRVFLVFVWVVFMCCLWIGICVLEYC